MTGHSTSIYFTSRTGHRVRAFAPEIRDRRQEGGWLIYERNRAWCRIRLDPVFRQQQASSVETRQQILADLRAAARAGDLRLADLLGRSTSGFGNRLRATLGC